MDPYYDPSQQPQHHHSYVKDGFIGAVGGGIAGACVGEITGDGHVMRDALGGAALGGAGGVGYAAFEHLYLKMDCSFGL